MARPTTTTVPSNDGVLIRVFAGQSTDYFVPSKEAPSKGYVERVGGGVPWLKEGSVVSYDPTRATAIDFDYVLVHQRAILATHESEVIQAAPCYPG